MRLSLAVISLAVACAGRAAAPPEPVTRAELVEEIAVKVQRVRKFLAERRMGGVLLSQVKNFSWMTAGLGDSHIVITSEIGAASLLVLADGRKYVLAGSNEIDRLQKEDLGGLGFEPRSYPWYEDRRAEIVRELAGGRPAGSDVPIAGLTDIERDFAPLRYELTPSEMKKYRWLGRHATEAVIAVCRKLRPGVTEREMEAMASDELMRRGIRPTVLLMGVDERLFQFPHSTPGGAKLRSYAFVNVCARRWGLVISTGRFVHIGPAPEDLRRRVRASAALTARYLEHSRPGASAGEILAKAKGWFDEEGYAGAWENHHQGGAIGYAEREWVAVPGSRETIRENQAVAWNPFVRGALSFDTFIVHRDRLENLNEVPGWPVIEVKAGASSVRLPDILELDRGRP